MRHAVIAGMAGAALLAATLLGGCRTRGPGTGAAMSSAPPTAEMRGAVWAALLKQRYVYEGTKLLVLEPSLLRDNSELIDRPRAAPADAWRAWRVADRRGGRLPEDLDPGLPVAWFTDKDWRALPEQNDWIEGRWKPFHERFPGNSGHISLGSIGFSRDGRTAVVAGFVGSGMLSASGDLHVLRLIDGAWQVVDSFNYVMA